MNTEVWPPGPPTCTTLSPGMVCSTSGTVRRWSRSMSAAVTTDTELPTCPAGVGMPVGLTTIEGSSMVLCASAKLGATNAATDASSNVLDKWVDNDTPRCPSRSTHDTGPIAQSSASAFLQGTLGEITDAEAHERRQQRPTVLIDVVRVDSRTAFASARCHRCEKPLRVDAPPTG